MSAGYYSDKYAVHTRDVLLRDGASEPITVQVFGRQDALLGGIDEAIAILKLCSTNWDRMEVKALHDGDAIVPLEVVLEITAPYSQFVHLETPVLGVLARRTRVGTNTRRVVEAAKPKDVMFFPARHDHWMVQTGDGYAAHVAGAIGVSTDAQASWWGTEGIGTVPHGLIAAYGGDTVRAATKFSEQMPEDVRLVCMADFTNDCVATSLELAKSLGDRLYGVRLDTSRQLVDASVVPMMGQFTPTGVNPQLVWNVRNALDTAGHNDVKIIVSGGLNDHRIREFEAFGVPVDAYGVGSSLFKGRFDFAAEAVRLDGVDCARTGGGWRENKRLESVR